MDELKIIVPDNFKEVGEKVNNHIKILRNENKDYLVPINLVRFNNGEGKAVINESVRNKDLYILSDVGNYDITYKMQRGIHHMMPDEHFQDIKRIISAECGHASKITLFMPYLYQSRQDKKTGRESLDCAKALQELESAGVDEIITCDAHNPAVVNAVPDIAYENFYATDDLLVNLIINENINTNNLLVVSPDEGAMKRARLFADMLDNVDVGTFYKQRDYSTISEGKNPIVAHKFLGPNNLGGKDVIIVDDMIASGGSILDTAERLKQLNAGRIFLVVTFALFTNGVSKFNEYYNKKLFNRVYATNLTYVPEEYKQLEWYSDVDCSLKIANIINELNSDRSIAQVLNGKTDTKLKIKALKKM